MAAYCSVLQCISVCCATSQCVAVCCRVLQCIMAVSSKLVSRTYSCDAIVIWFGTFWLYCQYLHTCTLSITHTQTLSVTRQIMFQLQYLQIGCPLNYRQLNYRQLGCPLHSLRQLQILRRWPLHMKYPLNSLRQPQILRRWLVHMQYPLNVLRQRQIRSRWRLHMNILSDSKAEVDPRRRAALLLMVRSVRYYADNDSFSVCMCICMCIYVHMYIYMWIYMYIYI